MVDWWTNLFVAATMSALVFKIYKKGLYLSKSVALSKHVTCYSQPDNSQWDGLPYTPWGHVGLFCGLSAETPTRMVPVCLFWEARKIQHSSARKHSICTRLYLIYVWVKTGFSTFTFTIWWRWTLLSVMRQFSMFLWYTV